MNNNVKNQKTHRYKIKQQLVDCLGGCCNRCGYQTTNQALEFHHIDSKTKEFDISYAVSRGVKIKLVIEEARKCILLCANCHAELHAKLWGLDNISIYRFDDSKLPYHIKDMTGVCPICSNIFKITYKNKNQKYCSKECFNKSKFKVPLLNREELEKLLWSMPIIQIAENFGVSDKCIAKWAERLNASKPPRGYWIHKLM